MYRDVKMLIDKKHEFYDYFDDLAHKANNLYNAGLFRARNILTGIGKSKKERFPNEKNVLAEMGVTIAKQKGIKHPTKEEPYVEYNFLYHMMYVNKNPDYFCEGMPAQTGQQILKNVVQNMKSYYKASKEYERYPKKFLGEPKLPDYKKSGGISSFMFTNQQVLKKQDYYRFPGTKLRLPLFDYIKNSWKLKEVKVIPVHKHYMLHLIFDDEQPVKSVQEISERICAIDLGVNNFAAITTNLGLPGLLVKGGGIKSINHWYNKQIGRIQSNQLIGTHNKFRSTNEFRRIVLKRNCVMDDLMHKVAKYVVAYCVSHNIDTLVVGENKGWKQHMDGLVNKKLPHSNQNRQNMAQIPHNKFKNMLEYWCAREGIRYIRHEEAYTSQASYKDRDCMKKSRHGGDLKFSGVRGPVYYLGQYKENGFHGLYRCHDGTILNSDLNGSANIGRKVFSDYNCSLDTFRNVQVILPEQIYR